MDRLLEYLANHPFLAGAAVLLTVAVIANEIRLRAIGGNAVGPAEAIALINRGGMVLDVRDRDSFARGHIVNASNIPLADLPDKLGSINKFRRKPLVTCCDNGISSARAAATLRREGFEQVFTLQGGLTAWSRDNLPLVVERSKNS